MARTAVSNRLLTQNYGKSLVFDGATNGVSLTGFKVSTTSFTIAFWVRVRKFTNNDRILDQQDSGPANGVSILLSNTNSPAINVVIRNNTTAVATLSGTLSRIIIDKWYHVIATYTENNANLYINNEFVNSDTSCTMSDSTASLLLGKRVGGSNYFNGYMKDFLVYNRVITEAERTNLYYRRKIPASPQVYLTLNDVITDSSGNNNNGSAVGTLAYSTSAPMSVRSTAGARSSLPQDYTINSGTLFEGFETFAEWSRQSAGGSIADETTIVKEGSHSLKLTAASASNCFADKTISTTFTNAGVIGMWINLPTLTGVNNIAIYLSSTTNYSKFFLRTINVTSMHEGWNYIETSREEWSNTGSEAWTNTFLRLRVRINASAGTPSCYFDSMYIGSYRRPKVLVTFDDSWDSQYTKAFAYMNPLGMKGTIYCIASKIDTSGYMTTAQCSEVNSAGWDLGTHGNVNLTTLSTQAEMETEISSNEAFLTSNGFTRANKHYAYPNGGYNDNAKLALAALDYKTARTIIDANQSHLYAEPYLIKRWGIYNTTSVATAKSYIDLAIARGNSVWLNYHIIVDADADASTKVLTADFQEVMDYLKTKMDAGLVDVVTVSEWYNGLTMPRKAVTA